MNFTYEAKATGYMIFWNGRPLGGAGIKGPYHGRQRREQIEENVIQARRTIAALKSGGGPKHMLDTLAKIKAEEE